MKKLSLALALATALASLQIAYGNMAAPSEPDMGAAVTLEENESLAVRSEVLDIVIDGETARITATYQMENTTDEPVSTQSMFLSPNMEYAGVQVTVDGQEVPYEAESFALHYETRIRTEDWRYAVLTRGETAAWTGIRRWTLSHSKWNLSLGKAVMWWFPIPMHWRVSGV